MNTRRAKLEDLPNLISMVSAAFLYNKDESVARDFPQLYSPNNINNLYVAEEAGALIAHTGFYGAEMRLEGGIIPVAGIGGVCTKPEAQGKGAATILLNEVIEAIKKEKKALAFLWTDKYDFYRKLGFELVGRQWCVELTQEALENLHKRVSDNSLDFQFSEKRTEKFFAQSFELLQLQCVGVIRTIEEHKVLLSSLGCKVYSAWNGDQLLAYFVVGKGKDLQGFIHEWAGEESALLWLLAQAAAQNSEINFLLSPQFMPHEESWIYILDELGFPMVAQYMAMTKLLELEPILAALKIYLRRLGIAPSELSIVPLAEGYELTWRENWKQTFTEPQLLRFLFGPELPEHEELRGIFPMRLWYWGMDSV